MCIQNNLHKWQLKNTMGLLKSLLSKATKTAASVQAANQIGKLPIDVTIVEGEDVDGRKWVRAYHKQEGYSDKYYY